MEELPVIAHIREVDCIGCTKCIQACPVDAIVGSAKWMHTVITQECTGCRLCVAPCPIDCIDLIPLSPAQAQTRLLNEPHHQIRKAARDLRLEKKHEEKRNKHTELKDILSTRRAYIQEAIQRVREKKQARNTAHDA